MIEYAALLVLFLLLSAFFSSSETAFFSLDSMRVETFLREERPGASGVAALLAYPTRLLSAILLANNLANTAAAAVGTVIATQIAPGGLGVLVATLAVTVLLVLFGEIGPKTVALEHNWAMARLYAPVLSLWSRAARPLVSALEAVSRTLLKLAGSRDETTGALALGDLRSAIHVGAQSGAVESQTSGVMLGALQLSERRIHTIMVHRSNVISIEAGESVREASRRLTREGYLRMPVYDVEADNIVGFVHASEVLAAATEGHLDRAVRDVMRRPLFEPASASVGNVLERMQHGGAQMVMVVDELGALAGVVTLEDVLEELVGEIDSETGAEPALTTPHQRAGRRLVVEGTRELSALDASLGVDLSRTDASTVAGLVLSELRRMPQVDDVTITGGLKFTVSRADERRVIEVVIEQMEPGDPPTA